MKRVPKASEKANPFYSDLPATEANNWAEIVDAAMGQEPAAIPAGLADRIVERIGAAREEPAISPITGSRKTKYSYVALLPVVAILTATAAVAALAQRANHRSLLVPKLMAPPAIRMPQRAWGATQPSQALSESSARPAVAIRSRVQRPSQAVPSSRALQRATKQGRSKATPGAAVVKGPVANPVGVANAPQGSSPSMNPREPLVRSADAASRQRKTCARQLGSCQQRCSDADSLCPDRCLGSFYSCIDEL